MKSISTAVREYLESLKDYEFALEFRRDYSDYTFHVSFEGSEFYSNEEDMNIGWARMHMIECNFLCLQIVKAEDKVAYINIYPDLSSNFISPLKAKNIEEGTFYRWIV